MAVLARRIGERRQRVAERAALAERIVERMIDRLRARVGGADAVLRNLPGRLRAQTDRGRDRLEGLMRRADSAVVNDLRASRAALVGQERMLQSLSYKNVLQRGYAVIRDAGDRPVSRAVALGAGAAISIEFSDGRVSAVTEGGEGAPGRPAIEPQSSPAPAKAVAAPRSAKRTDPPAGQGSLF